MKITVIEKYNGICDNIFSKRINGYEMFVFPPPWLYIFILKILDSTNFVVLSKTIVLKFYLGIHSEFQNCAIKFQFLYILYEQSIIPTMYNFY